MRKIAWAYGLSLALLVLVLVVIIRAGLQQGAAAVTKAPTPSVPMLHGLADPVSQILLQILLIVLVARVLGILFKRLGQPAVVGEMLAGIALGPSLLGSFAPGVTEFLFPSESLPTLSTLSQIGIILFMFGVGLELNTREIREHARSSVLLSHLSIVAPFCLGAMASFWLYDAYHGAGTSFLAFALFMGISMSITAFPVLARILQEKRLFRTRIGSTAITAAALNDLCAWCILAVIVALARAGSPAGALLTVAMAIVFFGVALVGVRPLLRRAAGGNDAEPTLNVMVLALVCAFGFALATQAIGVHAFFGAFLAGIVMPAGERPRSVLHDRLHTVTTLVLVPVFFAITGLRTEIGLLTGASDWLICLAIFGLAVAGKFGGGMLAARITGFSWRDSAGIGALMNTRGMVELIALNVGLDLGVLSPRIFTMLVLMAIATTMMTGPIISALLVSEHDSDA